MEDDDDDDDDDLQVITPEEQVKPGQHVSWSQYPLDGAVQPSLLIRWHGG